MALIRQWLASAAAFLLVAYFLPGFAVRDPIAALVASGVLGLLNALVRPILVFFTLPFTVLTLGLFLFLINGLLMWSVSLLVPGIVMQGWTTPIIAAVLVSLISWVVSGVFKALGR